MTSYSDTLQRGDTISCYQIEEVLGRGGFAVTYLAVDLNLDVHVAIKEYLPGEIIQRDAQLNVAARRPEFVEDYNIGLNNFAREAKTLARFKHLNIVRVHQVIHKFNTAYMVMDYEHGRELADVLAEHKTLSEDELQEVLFPIFDGVEEIHRHGLAHRDIKPSNIYLRDNGSPVLLDFGAARYTLSESTQQLTAVVTVGYTPIEQYNVSENEQGPWTDIYALAAVLYEAVTGEMPVDSVTRASSRVTNSTDPLSPVANKARNAYSDDFLKAIDWGLSMEAEDRPQSIAQWRDAFKGVYKPVEYYQDQQQKRPVRKSRLKTRAKEPVAALATETTQAYAPQPEYETATESSFSVDMRETGFADDFDDVEIVPLNPDAEPALPRERLEPAVAATYSDATATLAPPPAPASPFASNPSPKLPPAPQPENQELNDTLNNLIDAEGRPKHTQQLRKVLRRDIVKREHAPAEPVKVAPQPEPYRAPTVAKSPLEAEPAISAERYDERRYQRDHDTPSPARQRFEDDFDFDDTDWDYEPPPGPSRWKWIFPVLGLALIAGASILFVNKPELFKLPSQTVPELTVATALENANEKIQNRELIFPEGQSALDYFQLILQSEPDNAEALGGVAAIRDEIKKQIVEHVDDNNLAEANRLLSRAKAANLQIDDTTDSGVAGGDNQIVAIDTTASPWVNQRVEDIEGLLAVGDYAGARQLYAEVDKYIANAEVSDSIRQRIERGLQQAQPATQDSPTTDAIATPIDTSPIVAEVDNPAIESLSDTPVQSDVPANNGTETDTANAVVVDTDPVVTLTPVATPASLAEPQAPVVSETEQKIAVEDDEATLPSAPRRSFIEGNDATAQHLNQLRLALEDKNLQRVLQVSGTLPEERTEFLRRLFQRYDRLDVTIDNINRTGSNARAKLSVAMFNQRSDGSFYSAGKWSDVELATTRQNGQWQPIRW